MGNNVLDGSVNDLGGDFDFVHDEDGDVGDLCDDDDVGDDVNDGLDGGVGDGDALGDGHIVNHVVDDGFDEVGNVGDDHVADGECACNGDGNIGGSNVDDDVDVLGDDYLENGGVDVGGLGCGDSVGECGDGGGVDDHDVDGDVGDVVAGHIDDVVDDVVGGYLDDIDDGIGRSCS